MFVVSHPRVVGVAVPVRPLVSADARFTSSVFGRGGLLWLFRGLRGRSRLF